MVGITRTDWQAAEKAQGDVEAEAERLSEDSGLFAEQIRHLTEELRAAEDRALGLSKQLEAATHSAEVPLCLMH